jgi:hypothetical protein
MTKNSLYVQEYFVNALRRDQALFVALAENLAATTPAAQAIVAAKAQGPCAS